MSEKFTLRALTVDHPWGSAFRLQPHHCPDGQGPKRIECRGWHPGRAIGGFEGGVGLPCDLAFPRLHIALHEGAKEDRMALEILREEGFKLALDRPVWMVRSVGRLERVLDVQELGRAHRDVLAHGRWVRGADRYLWELKILRLPEAIYAGPGRQKLWILPEVAAGKIAEFIKTARPEDWT